MMLCFCGSGKPRVPVYDGYRIFLCYVCEQCRVEKLSHYRDDIFTRYECDEPIEEE